MGETTPVEGAGSVESVEGAESVGSRGSEPRRRGPRVRGNWEDRGGVGALLRRLRLDRGLTQDQLATRAGVTRSWLSVVEAGRRERPEREMLEQVAATLAAPPETILAAAGYRVTPLPMPRRRSLEEIVAELEVITREAPLLVPEASRPASAGPGAPGDGELWPYYPRPSERGHDFVAVEVVGTCMEPRIPRGARVIVDRSASPRPGDVVVALHEGELVVKLLAAAPAGAEGQAGDGGQYLVALQGEPPLHVGEETQILGVVVYWGMRP